MESWYQITRKQLIYSVFLSTFAISAFCSPSNFDSLIEIMDRACNVTLGFAFIYTMLR